MRLSIYQKLSGLSTEAQVEDLSREISDRFGILPLEVSNLLYAVRLKTISTQNGIESISTNDNIVTIRIFPGIVFNRQKLSKMYKYGIKIGISQLIINISRLGKEWQSMLEEIIKSVV
jgi:transcription-repair coupling factor (superfamily II helicase)